ncbi:GNAT family N-acetyltransferase [Xanthomonas sp. XNM01]|nr:GNAT family N-acetyltransferase [Xanthomonas sp. XNM01]
MRIACLSAWPQHVDALAAAHVAAFGALEPGWDAAAAAAELRAHRADGLPATLLALDRAGGWLGSVSLLHEDHPQIRQYTPWLASLYVQPQARAEGLGARLVGQAVARAAELGHPWLHLYCTDDLRGYYARLGWDVCDRGDLGMLQVWVMRVACAVPDLHSGVDAASRPVARIGARAGAGALPPPAGRDHGQGDVHPGSGDIG